MKQKNTRKIKILADEYGDLDAVIARHSFEAEFKLMQNVAWLDAVQSDALTADLAKENMIGVDGVKDEQGNAIPYSDELKEALFNETWLVKYLNEAFMAVQGGIKQTEMYKKEKRKN